MGGRGGLNTAYSTTVTTPTTTRIRFLAASAKRPQPGPGPRNISRPSVGPAHNLRSGRPPPASQQTPRRSVPHNNRRQPRTGGARNACADKRSRSEARSLLPNVEATSPPPPTRHPVPVATWLAKNKHHNPGCIQRHELATDPGFDPVGAASRRSGPTLCVEVWLAELLQEQGQRGAVARRSTHGHRNLGRGSWGG